MKTEFLRATTEDKLILQGIIYSPDQPTNKVVLHIHGMAGNFYENRFLDAMAKTFTDNGWAFLAPNTRGHDFIADFPVEGDKEEFRRVGSVFEKFEECILDIKCWMDFAEKRGFSYVVLQGHSLGCSKVVYYLSKTKDERVKKLVLASPSDMVGWIERGPHHDEMMSLAKEWVSHGKGNEILPKLLDDCFYLSAETYLDFGVKGNPVDVINTHDPEAPSVLADIKVPTLAFFGSKDYADILPLDEALGVIKQKAKNAPQLDTDIVKGASHGYFSKEQEVAKLILGWINKKLK